MKSLEKETQTIKDGGDYSFKTIDDFGWGSHINSSAGGLVIYMKTGTTVIMNQNENKTGFCFAYDYDLTEDQLEDIEYLVTWITE